MKPTQPFDVWRIFSTARWTCLAVHLGVSTGSLSHTSHMVDPHRETIRVLAAVVRRGERYLVCQRAAHKRHGGLWEFPGGKCEFGESDADAARRELSEELGVHVTSVGAELFAAHDIGSPFLIAFVEVAIDRDPVCHEHSAATWALPAEMKHLPLAPSDRKFAEYLLQQSVGDGHVA